MGCMGECVLVLVPVDRDRVGILFVYGAYFYTCILGGHVFSSIFGCPACIPCSLSGFFGVALWF